MTVRGCWRNIFEKARLRARRHITGLPCRLRTVAREKILASTRLGNSPKNRFWRRQTRACISRVRNRSYNPASERGSAHPCVRCSCRQPTFDLRSMKQRNASFDTIGVATHIEARVPALRPFLSLRARGWHGRESVDDHVGVLAQPSACRHRRDVRTDDVELVDTEKSLLGQASSGGDARCAHRRRLACRANRRRVRTNWQHLRAIQRGRTVGNFRDI